MGRVSRNWHISRPVAALATVAPRMGRVSRNEDKAAVWGEKFVAPRKRRVSRNNILEKIRAHYGVAPRKRRVSRNCSDHVRADRNVGRASQEACE